ncbi:MAG TPA: LysR family transcriptional regulator [Desulfitobacterium dehalogenans]|uniref:LysR family transcriptional regulator n=1 Tax=Desulfitobacterium dehalogenans TaxID=36854 RepID=A0A7C7D4Z2_9FIRM|nr:LysR family transcriptional regulator [Desulfitobacterium dehalogenans]
MNLHALNIFIKVATFQSVTKAAEQLCISQPAVTIQIRNLEKELGLKLLESSGRGVQLTPDGEFIYSEGRRIFLLEQSIENKINEHKNKKMQSFKIASTYVPGYYLLPSLLAQYKIQYPLSGISLETGNTQYVISQILNYEVDIGVIVSEGQRHPDIRYEHFLDMSYCFIVPINHPFAHQEITIHQFVQEPIILREKGSSTRSLLEAFCKIYDCPFPPIGLQLSGLNESLKAVAAGFGTMLAPSIAVEELLHQKKIAVVSIEDIQLTRPIYLCMRKVDGTPTAMTCSFIKYLKRQSHKIDEIQI